MGVDTDGFLRKEVSAREVYNVIVEKFDKDAIFDVEIDKYDQKERGRISFKDGEDNRSIFYCVTGDRKELFNGEEHACLILGCWGRSTEIMVEIVKSFGGYVNENDCDDVEEFFVPKDGEFEFGEYVKIQNRIMECFDDSVTDKNKVILARQIINNKDRLLTILQSI